MVRINRQACDGCGCCIAVCREDALVLSEAGLALLEDRCLLCRRCIQACPIEALREEEHARPV